MSQKTERDAMKRRLALLLHLPRYPKRKSLAELHGALESAGFDVSRRQLQRDMAYLSTHFPVECDSASIPGWGWSKEARHEFLQYGLDVHTALAFALAEKHLKPLLPRETLKHLQPFFEQANASLNRASGRKLGDWSKRTHLSQRGLVPLPHDINPAVHACVSSALVEGRRISATYEKRDGTVGTYELSPLGLLSRSNVLYLIAKPHADPGTPDKGLRSFALHRFHSAERLEAPCERVPDFDLAALDRAGMFGIALSEGLLSVRLRFEPESGRAFKTTKYSETQKVIPCDDGTVIVEFETPNTMELRWWILGYGGKCEVLEPPGLRREIEAAMRPVKSA